MVTMVAIFDIDNAPDMDKAVEQLAAAGFDNTVYDEAIVPEDTGTVAPVFAPGSAAPVVLDSPDSPPEVDLGTIIRAFRHILPATTCLTKRSIPTQRKSTATASSS